MDTAGNPRVERSTNIWQTVKIKHEVTRPEVDLLIDESFISTAFHDVNGRYQQLHTALVDCIAIGGRGLEAITFTPTDK